MRVKISTLWGYCAGWFIADTASYLAGWHYDFEPDFCIAVFLASAWIFERILPTASPHERQREA